MNTVKKLSNLKTYELTLTQRGANRRVFAIAKSAKGNVMPTKEIINALIDTPAEGEENLVATLKSAGMSQEKIDAATISLRLQAGMKDLVDTDTFDSVAKAAGYDFGKGKEGEDDEDPKKKKKAKKPEGVKKSVDLDTLDPEAKAIVEGVFKSNADLVEKSAKMEETLKSLTSANEKREFVAKAAEDFSHINMESDALGSMLQQADAVGEDFSKGFNALLKGMNEVVQKSALLQTTGSATISGGTADAWAKIEALAEGLVQKSDKAMSKAEAVSVVMKTEEGQQLYNDYLKR